MLQHHLLSLADELILSILDDLSDDKKSLRNLSSTCRRFQDLAEPLIYRDIFLRYGDTAKATAASLLLRPERASFVRDLNMRIKYCHDEGMEEFSPLVEKMVNLREWQMESPWTNYARWKGEGRRWAKRDFPIFAECFQRASLQAHVPFKPLQRLQKLTIHSHDIQSDFWVLSDGMEDIFLHPTLRFIHVSACIISSVDESCFAPFANTTPLETLILDECNIECRSLGVILWTPKALKHLTIGENSNHGREMNEHGVLNGRELLQAMLSQKHSLKSLRHVDARAGRHGDYYDATVFAAIGGLQEFMSLERMEIAETSFIVPCLLVGSGPPSLASLRFMCGLRDYSQKKRMTQANLDCVQELKLVEMEQHYFHHTDIGNWLWEDAAVRKWHSWAYDLHKCGIRAKLLVKMHGSLFPPYLYGEWVPEEHCVYDSADMQFEDESGTMDVANDLANLALEEKDSEASHATSRKREKEPGRLSEAEILRLKERTMALSAEENVRIDEFYRDLD